jgi:CPA2 family monovalent cation:H+ antiporter-2
VVTMALTPFAARLAPVIYGRWRERFPREIMQTFNLPETGLKEHVIVAGYGRVGSFVAGMLHRLERPVVVVDVNPDRVKDIGELGLPAVYGDAAAEPVLGAAGVDRARLFIVTLPDPVGARLVIERVRRLNPDLHVVARSTSAEHLEDLGRLGVYEAVQPEFEAGLELGRQALVHLGIGAGEVQRFSDGVRRERYASISEPSREGPLEGLRRASSMIEIDWVDLPEDSPLAGRTIGELRIRPRTGASIVAVVRGGEVFTNPGADFAFAPGDAVSVLGVPDQRAAFLAMVDANPDDRRGETSGAARGQPPA